LQSIKLPSLPTPQAAPLAAKVMAVQAFDVALQKSPTLRSQPGAVRAVGSQAVPTAVPAGMQVPVAPIVSMPTHDRPVAQGIVRVQLAPATPSVMHDIAMPIEPGVVKQV
jgi:hypothetical protein